MSDTHFSGVGGYIKHREASNLFPVESLSADVQQYRDAQITLNAVDSQKVLTVSPSSLASSYYLTQHPLTAIKIESLSQKVRTSLADKTDIDLSQFEIIQIGKQPVQNENRSLTEF